MTIELVRDLAVNCHSDSSCQNFSRFLDFLEKDTNRETELTQNTL
jgi:hypothetical protein